MIVKKILFVMHSLEYGGAERSLVNLMNELPGNRYHIDILLFQKKGDFLQLLPDWVNVLDTPKALNGLYAPVREAGCYLPVKVAGTLCAKLLRRTKKARSAFRWRRFYRRQIPVLPTRYDTAVAYVGGEVMYFVHDCVQAERKLVWIHNDYRTAGYSKKDDAPYLAAMDEIVSVSQGCVDVLWEEFPELVHKMHYIENISSSSAVRAMADAFMPPEYQKDGVNILSVGRLWPQKGFDLAVKAAAVLKKQGLKFKWFIVGEGSLRPELEKQIEAEGLQDTFFLLGTRLNPYPYIKNCTVMVQSSRYEGKSVVLDEAKILCTPIAATCYPTVADQVTDGREGLITEMSGEGLAQGVMKLVQDEQLRRSMQEYMAQHEYGNQQEVEKYIKLIG